MNLTLLASSNAFNFLFILTKITIAFNPILSVAGEGFYPILDSPYIIIIIIIIIINEDLLILDINY
jgi:hypothetical protein